MWIKQIVRAASPEEHILCVPWAGAGPENFFPWLGALAPDVSLSAVHLPGRSTRFGEPLPSSTGKIVEQVVAAILEMPPHPTVIFGHSFGAILAFEICRALERLGQQPRRLVVSGSSAPPLVPGEPKIAHLAPDAFLAKVAEYGGLTPDVLASGPFLDIFTPILRADFAALEAYRFDEGAPLGCPILVLSGRADPSVPPQGLEAWRGMSRAGCAIRLFEGDHFFFAGKERTVVEAIVEAAQ